MHTPFALLLAALLTLGCSAPAPVPDGGVDAGVDAGAPEPVPVEFPRIASWADRLKTFRVTSTVTGIATREVAVLLPQGYAEPANAARRYPVFVMHDGANCLDRDPFQHGGWQVHTISTDLAAAGKMAPVIVVMVDNTSSRTEEYVRTRGTAPGPTADGYLDFLERDVLPWVDRTWRTQPAPAGRGIGGSSYGGLISLDAAWRRPGVWGVVMAMSPAFGYDFPAFAGTQGKLPLRVYLDSGTIDWGGGDDGMAGTIALRDLLVGKGWVLETNLKHAIGQNHNHSEDFWRQRLPAALQWLYPP